MKIIRNVIISCLVFVSIFTFANGFTISNGESFSDYDIELDDVVSNEKIENIENIENIHKLNNFVSINLIEIKPVIQDETENTTTISEETHIESNISSETDTFEEDFEFVEPQEIERNKIEISQLNYNYDYSEMSEMQKRIITSFHNYINGKEYEDSITINEVVDFKTRREIQTYFVMYFGSFSALGDIVKVTIVDETSTIFDIQEENINKYMKEKEKNDDMIDEILTSMYNDNEYEMVNQFINYMIENYSYNVDNSDIPQILNEKTGSCNAYSLLFYTLCNRVGIKCDLITGYTSENDTGYHAWNKVQYDDGTSFYYDITCYDSSRNSVFLDNYESPWYEKGINQYIK